MNIVLPIVFFAVCLGLFAKRMGAAQWCAMGVWVALVIAYNYVKA